MSACRLAGKCSGCPWIEIPYPEQLQKKQEAFAAGWRGLGFPDQNFVIHSAGELATRDRADLQFHSGVLGLYELGKREVVAMDRCPAMSPELEAWFLELKNDLPPIQKGSFRLRKGADGQRGVWLDFANEDVKRLFEERSWLERLSKKAIVEVGQRKKRLSFAEGRPRLLDPVLHPWMSTLVNEKPVPLWTTIGSFSQPGEKVNHLLVKTLMRQIEKLSEPAWMELGAGSGNFTLPLLAQGREVIAVEIDSLSVQGLRRSVGELSSSGNLQVIEKSFEAAGVLPRVAGMGVLVDPPRSGLGKFLQSPILTHAKCLVYVSCWSESFFKDALQLKALGYEPMAAEAVDLFPGTPYSEWVTTFIRVVSP